MCSADVGKCAFGVALQDCSKKPRPHCMHVCVSASRMIGSGSHALTKVLQEMHTILVSKACASSRATRLYSHFQHNHACHVSRQIAYSARVLQPDS